MAGLFSRVSGFIRPQSPHTSLMDEEEDEVSKRDGAGEKDFDGEIRKAGSISVEFDMEFKPIEHPPEPEEDRPVKCPMLDSSLLKKDEGVWNVLFAETSQIRAESLVAKEERTSEQPPLRAESKRHHFLKRDHIKSSSFRGPRNNFLRVFQQCKECEF